MEPPVTIAALRFVYSVLGRLMDDEKALIGNMTYFHEARRSVAALIVEREMADGDAS